MNKLRLYPVLVALLTLSWTLPAVAVSPEALKNGIPSLAPMLQQVTPAVVSIRVTKTASSSNDFSINGQQLPEELRRYFENLPGLNGDANGQSPYARGAGSGVIIDADAGYVITNHHVVDGASEILVQLSDNRNFTAKLLGTDASTDVALLEIEATALVDIKFADISTVQVGDYVVAIGNPFGIGQTATAGIVSALGRAGLNNANYEDFIQTDAAINLGNSGGALIDMEGRLIGMNTAIISGNGGSNGIGFAVPGDMLSAVVAHLQRDGEVRRGMLGVSIADVTPDVIAALNIDVDFGAVVTSIVPDSAAELAGVQISDVIVEIDGESLRDSRELRNTVGLKRQGQEVELVLYREGKKMTLNARIGGPEGQAAVTERQPALSAAEFRGAQLQNITPDAAAAIEAGVQIVAVAPQSPAAVAGLQEGDVIVEVNRNAVTTTTEFNAALAGAGRLTALTVVRDGQRLLLFVS
ncbi:MAG: Do family serine endopeptidase [Gammaproteobacteria bacterium]|nr:Do family serine endopeptidase [Gammaproteobacteria bacterium]